MAWTSPSTWVAGAILTATQLNAQLRDNFKAIGDPWTSYTSTLTNVTLGTGGTSVARFASPGKLTFWSISITLGTGGAVSGTLGISLPVASRLRFAGTIFGDATLWDSSANAFRVWHATHDATSNGTRVFLTDDTGNVAGAAAPWTWASGDKIEINGCYEAN